jgi:hypothetical protein
VLVFHPWPPWSPSNRLRASLSRESNRSARGRAKRGFSGCGVLCW